MATTNKFKFKLLTGTDPAAQYAAIGTYDSYTFYLLGTGEGYLGTVPLFGGGTNTTVIVNTAGALTTLEAGKFYVVAIDGVNDGGTPAVDYPQGVYYSDGTTLTNLNDKAMAAWIAKNAVTNMIGTTSTPYTGDDTTLPTTKAVVDLIENKLTNSSILQAQFFRTVVSYTVKAEDVDTADAGYPSALATEGVFPVGTEVGDVGLLFTRDDDMTDDGATDTGETHTYISLKGYIDVYDSENTDSVKMTLDTTNGNKFKAELNIRADEKSLLVDNTVGANGVYLNKTTDQINDGDGTTDTDTGLVNTAPSADRLVTEKALVDYINDVVLQAVSDAIDDALEDVVTYTVDDGTGGTTPPVGP